MSGRTTCTLTVSGRTKAAPERVCVIIPNTLQATEPCININHGVTLTTVTVIVLVLFAVQNSDGELHG